MYKLGKGFAADWMGLYRRMTVAGYSEALVSGIGSGRVDHVTRTIYMDPSLTGGDLISHFSTLVAEMEQALAAGGEDVQLAETISEYDAGSLCGIVGSILIHAGDGALRTKPMRAAVAALRKKVPGASWDVDDLKPDTPFYVRELVVAAQARVNDPDVRSLARLEALCERSPLWRRDHGGAEHDCGEQVWMATTSDGGMTLTYVAHICGDYGEWRGCLGTARCTEHAARAAEVYAGVRGRG